MARTSGGSRIVIILVVCCVLAAAASGVLFFNKPPQVENVILISFDDLRTDRLGCYGNKRDVSPFLDKLAREGSQFMRAFTSWPFTPPSHVSLLTSLYPQVFNLPLDPKVNTLAKVLAEHGFITAAFTGGGFMSSDYGVFSGFQEYDDSVSNLGIFSRTIRQWLGSHQNEKFFLFLHTYYVHEPFVAPKKYFQEYANPDYSGPVFNDPISTMEFIDAANKRRIEVNPEDVQRILDIYDGQIHRADDFMKQLVNFLEKIGILENTMLVITSDHGEQFFEFGYFAHSAPSRRFPDISTRVPLIFSCPQFKPKGKIDGMVELIDIPPTILDAVGIQIPDAFQGKSLFPLISRKFHHFFKKKKEIYYTNDGMTGIRTDKYKLTMVDSSGEIQLFDLI